jgi:hypothetical protein
VTEHLPPDQEPVQRPPDAEARASAGRIVDILQQLVLARPDLIIPLEELVREFLESRQVGVVTRMGEGPG